MIKIRTLLIAIIMMIIILIGTGYAMATQSEFSVRFSGKPIIEDNEKVKAEIINEVKATMYITGLSMKDNKETITYIVQNTSRDLSADLSVKVTNNNKEYFSVDTEVEKSTLIRGEATKVVVTVELMKQPIQEIEESKIDIELVSKPIQPNGGNSNQNGQTSGGNDNPNSTNSSNNNYGYYEKDETPKTGRFKIIDIFRR